MQSNFIKITFWYGCSPARLLHIFRTPFLKNTAGGLLLKTAGKKNFTSPKMSKTEVPHLARYQYSFDSDPLKIQQIITGKSLTFLLISCYFQLKAMTKIITHYQRQRRNFGCLFCLHFFKIRSY